MTDRSLGVPLLDVNRDNAPHREEFLEALTEVLDSGRFLFGPDVSELENEVAAYTETPNAVGCASGSDALLLSLMALDVKAGDEVIVPSFTFFASVSCITRLGATPVFADICPDTYNVDPESIESLITDKTAAIIPVHLFGQCAQIDRICEIAAKHDIPVVEDAAQAIGAAYKDRPAGSWGQVGCFSFYPTKNLGGMGDGGILTSNDASFADRLRLFAGHGMRPRYYHQVVGINSRLDTFQAAVLRVKLRHLDAAVEARTVNANRYTRLLTEAGLVGEGQLETPYHDSNARHVWNQYTLRVPGERRDALRAHLSERNIGSEIYYPVPMHKQECFQDIMFRHNGLEHTEAASAEVLNLPIFPSLTEEEQIRVVDSIASFYQQASRAAA
ncbi:DegT/DnrJ/EryC1/StrS family aminotransferase [Rhodopirellula halodulae]|uniref:DegT/DnrJ/EryC1/StrS family aminotransferase n=1 Tax=Rhodopirellula halodulae TaxID=2894198 RepID=UPI001E50C206|nr:DegT/DnrJ/EryC1/StrS family aminotransferase [Rhodopirellula sp. JC737]MCC9655247.1 DegT/DnrJ/EryC1/StrS family aminotransferase [Rhodopirellula sp. JC737]